MPDEQYRTIIRTAIDGFWRLNILVGADRVAALVVVGARPDRTKEMLAIEDGYRVSIERDGKGRRLITLTRLSLFAANSLKCSGSLLRNPLVDQERLSPDARKSSVVPT